LKDNLSAQRGLSLKHRKKKLYQMVFVFWEFYEFQVFQAIKQEEKAHCLITEGSYFNLQTLLLTGYSSALPVFSSGLYSYFKNNFYQFHQLFLALLIFTILR
jgi:hypothetical protein